MKIDKFFVAIAALVLLFFILAGAFYPLMPEVMASHWNAAGEADGTISRFWGLFLFPLISLGIAALLLAIPKIDPLKANIQKFRSYYYGFIVVFLAYFLYVYILTLVWNLGLRFDFTVAIMPAVGVLMFFIGVLVGKAKRNFFIGIRTPWTLSSEEVWNRTHRLGGRLFKIAGVIIVLLSFAGETAIYIMMGLILVVAVWLIVYSYVLFRRLGLPLQPPFGGVPRNNSR
jgi:uncharacterized membrane protein